MDMKDELHDLLIANGSFLHENSENDTYEYCLFGRAREFPRSKSRLFAEILRVKYRILTSRMFR